MYRVYKNILHSVPGDLKILVKSDTCIFFEEFYGSFPGVSRMIREVSHVCKCGVLFFMVTLIIYKYKNK